MTVEAGAVAADVEVKDSRGRKPRDPELVEKLKQIDKEAKQNKKQLQKQLKDIDELCKKRKSELNIKSI